MWKPPSPPAPDAASVSPPPESNKMRNPGRRFAQTVRLKRDSVAAYKECHAKVWPEVEKQIRDCSIVDYSIFYDDTTSLLFASFKYVGYDFAGDMARMAENPKVREWWAMTDSYQESLVPGATGSAVEEGEPGWWKPMEEVFYQA